MRFDGSDARTNTLRRAGALLLLLAAASCAKAPALPSGPSGANHVPGKFVWHALLTDDVDGARRFYGSLLGWQFETVGTDGKYNVIRSGRKDVGTLVLVEPPSPGERITQWLSFVSVDDVNATTGLFKRKGRVYRGPTDIPEFGRVAIVADPLGAPLALIRTAKGDPPDGDEPAQHEWLWREYVAANPESAFAFYHSAFGYNAKVELEGEHGPYWVLRSGEHGRAGGFRCPWPTVKPNWLPYVRVEDAAEAAHKVESLGGKVLLAPSPSIRNGSLAIVADPQGAVLALQKYPF